MSKTLPLLAVYHSVTTLTTVGYGDRVPSTDAEKIVYTAPPTQLAPTQSPATTVFSAVLEERPVLERRKTSRTR